ncbi:MULTISPECIES: hypothetical protein [Leisingera]|uniref:hypothetical protein n=1 Tax=Leisingera TaxID=191028 RepID=UPI000483E60F|nr:MULTISPECIES: hypothetical protein [Leisingera]
MLRLFPTVLTLAAPVAATAAPEKFLCSFAGHSSARENNDGGFVPGKSMLNVDAQNSTATVYDAFTHMVYNAPVATKFTKKSNGMYRLRWKVKGVPVTITTTYDYGIPEIIKTKFTVRYSLLFNPETLQGKLSVSGGGERFTSSGKFDCDKTNKNLVF